MAALLLCCVVINTGCAGWRGYWIPTCVPTAEYSMPTTYLFTQSGGWTQRPEGPSSLQLGLCGPSFFLKFTAPAQIFRPTKSESGCRPPIIRSVATKGRDAWSGIRINDHGGCKRDAHAGMGTGISGIFPQSAHAAARLQNERFEARWGDEPRAGRADFDDASEIERVTHSERLRTPGNGYDRCLPQSTLSATRLIADVFLITVCLMVSAQNGPRLGHGHRTLSRPVHIRLNLQIATHKNSALNQEIVESTMINHNGCQGTDLPSLRSLLSSSSPSGEFRICACPVAKFML